METAYGNRDKVQGPVPSPWTEILLDILGKAALGEGAAAPEFPILALSLHQKGTALGTGRGVLLFPKLPQLFIACLIHGAVFQGPVGSFGLKVKVGCHICQTMVGELRQARPGQVEGIHIIVVNLPVQGFQSSLGEEEHVESMYVMAHQNIFPSEAQELFQGGGRGGRCLDHLIRDAVYGCCGRGDGPSRIYQGGKFLLDLVSPDSDAGDFNDFLCIRTQSGGFQVEYDIILCK